MTKSKKPESINQRTAGNATHESRTVRWEFNGKLFQVSAAVVTVVALLVAAGYWYQSKNIATSLLDLANKAEESGDWEKQLAWLRQLQILTPTDSETTIAVANAADKCVELPPANRYDRVQRARNLISEATALLRKQDGDSPILEELERRLIERELQFGALYASNIRRRVIGLNAQPKDLDLLRAFAIAKHALEYTSAPADQDPDQETVDKEIDYWLWLDQQPLTQIIATAWKENPQDMELASRLASEILKAQDSLQSDVPAEQNELESELKKQLTEASDSGRAALIQHSLLLPKDPNAAYSVLDKNVEASLTRLRENTRPVKDTQAANELTDGETTTVRGSTQTIRTLPPLHSKINYEPLWDFNLATSWARAKLNTAEPDYGKIHTVLDQLLTVQAPTIPNRSIEEVYVLRTRNRTDENSASIDALLIAGIERLGLASSRLQLQRAAQLTTDGDLENAKQAVDELTKTLQVRRGLLLGAEANTLTSEQKSAEETSLALLDWRTNILRGIIATQEDSLDTACEIFRDSLRSQIAVSSKERLRATLLLADAYRSMEAWDLAATTYEAASLLDPNQQQLRVLAADAWTSAGNLSNAFAQWRTIQGNSLLLETQQLRALIAEEFAKPPSRRSFETIWRTLDTLESKLPTSTEKTGEENIADIKSELAILSLAVPDRDDGTARKSTLQRLQNLAEASPNNSGIQKAAALSLARAGKIDDSRKCVKRLEEIEGKNSLTFVITNAKVEVEDKNVDKAIEQLLTHARNKPDDVLDASLLAAEYLAKQDSIGKAYDTLLEIPSENHNPESVFTLFSFALTEIPRPVTAQTDFSRLTTVEQLFSELKDPTQTWWKLAKAIRLLTESGQEELSAEESAALVKTASQLSEEISDARPRWGLGLSLAGQISAARGETMAAIQSLQAGISNGDVRLSSSFLLTQLLLKANRVVEAEEEYSRFERLRQANANIAAFGVSIAERKGDYEKSLEVARQAAVANDQDEIAWLLVAQAAIVAARSTNNDLAKDDLLSEARTALDVALKLSDDSSVRAYQIRLRFRAEFFDKEALFADIAQLSESRVDEPTRSLLAGLSYLQAKNAESAFSLLKRAEEFAPQDPRIFLALSEYYQVVGDDQNTITSLEQAYKFAPNRIDVRNRLAIALALRSGADIPWDRLRNLLDTNLVGDSQNKLLHALILLNRGDNNQEKQAEGILRQLIKSDPLKADDARRLLASLLRNRWGTAASIDSNSPDAQRALSETRVIYSALINRAKPKPLDIYRLGDLLLRAEQTQDVTALADQLDAITKGSPVALDLRLRLAKQKGDSESISKYTKDWADKAMEVEGLLQASVWETAGQLLSRLGYHQESIDWLEKAYRDDPKKFRPYIVGLTRARRFDEAMKLCVEQYNVEHAADTAAAMADVAVLMGLGFQARSLSDKEEAIFAQALKEHPKSAKLFEAIATMRLAQERYSEAIPLYKESAKFSPDNVRLLNNLAMALSEIPGREHEAIPYARKAINLYGRSPELLDTLGLVLARNKKTLEAEQVLREAVSASPDPRYRFHLLVALMGQGKSVEAISEWSQLDINALQEAALTPAERRDLNEIRQRFKG